LWRKDKTFILKSKSVLESFRQMLFYTLIGHAAQ